MGSDVSATKNILSDWTTIDHQPQYNILQHKSKNQLAEIRKFTLDPVYDPHDQLQIYETRKNPTKPIVRVYEASLIQQMPNKKKSSSLCGKICNLAVISQRIPSRLSDLPQLPFPKALLILLKTLQAFQFMFKKVGPVNVTAKMIGINIDGEVKAWINEDFSKNYPTSKISTLLMVRQRFSEKDYRLIEPQYRDEEEVIQNIIDIVKNKCQGEKFPEEFDTMLRKNIQSFGRAFGFINGYIEGKKITIPKIIQVDQNEFERSLDPPKRIVNQNWSIQKEKLQGKIPLSLTDWRQNSFSTRNAIKNEQRKPQKRQSPIYSLGSSSSLQFGLGHAHKSSEFRNVEPLNNKKNVKITFGNK